MQMGGCMNFKNVYKFVFVLFIFFAFVSVESGMARNPRLDMSFAEIQKLANQGDADSQYIMGLAYYQGEIVEKDYKKSVYWYRKAADQGSYIAQFMLGFMYHFGKGVEKDEDKAIYWIQKSADQGNPEAKNLLEKLKKQKK